MKSMDEKIMIQVRETGQDWEPSVECPAGDCHHNDDDDDDDDDDDNDDDDDDDVDGNNDDDDGDNEWHCQCRGL